MVRITLEKGNSFLINGAVVAIEDVIGTKVALCISERIEAHEDKVDPGDIVQRWLSNKVRGWLASDPRRTVQQLADAVGVSSATVTRWRKGAANVCRNHLEPLLEALGVNLPTLRDEVG